PTGGGMRNTFGATSFGREDLPLPTWQEEYALDEFDTQLNDFISVGADFRTLLFYQDSPVSPRLSFFQMQSDLYVSARILKRTSIYLNKGLGNRFEAFGIAGILPLNGYVKVGWFAPAYGLRMDDHNIFVREKTLFGFGGGQDAGIEFGLSPGPVTLTAGISNGSIGDRDDNKRKALLGRAETRFRFAPVNVHLGGSYYNNPGPNSTLTLYGAFVMVTVGNSLTLMGEVDQRREYSPATGLTTSGLITFLEANYLLMPGIDLKVGYDFFDPDIDFKTGSQSRIYFGVEVFPLPGIEVRPLYVIRKEVPVDVRNDQLIVMLHLYL
ncbi:MAG: hypothetical protein WD295_00255, partial [Bacteroidota bacterium]